MSRLPSIGAGILALLLAAGPLAGGFAQAQDKPPVADTAITQRVERALQKDRTLGSMHIRVETSEGVVNLTGFVRSMEDIARAGELVRAVPGVTTIRNDLRVANRPSRA